MYISWYFFQIPVLRYRCKNPAYTGNIFRTSTNSATVLLFFLVKSAGGTINNRRIKHVECIGEVCFVELNIVRDFNIEKIIVVHILLL